MNLNATLIVQVFVFWALWWFTAKFVWPPITQVLDERARKISEGLNAAERSKSELQALSRRVDEELGQARIHSASIRAEAEGRADSLIEVARGESVQILNLARTNAELEAKAIKEAAAIELLEKVGTLIVSASEKILKREISEENHSLILSDAISELKSICTKQND